MPSLRFGLVAKPISQQRHRGADESSRNYDKLAALASEIAIFSTVERHPLNHLAVKRERAVLGLDEGGILSRGCDTFEIERGPGGEDKVPHRKETLILGEPETAIRTRAASVYIRERDVERNPADVHQSGILRCDYLPSNETVSAP